MSVLVGRRFVWAVRLPALKQLNLAATADKWKYAKAQPAMLGSKKPYFAHES